MRVDIPAGDITVADAYELLPFANTLFELEMTGAEIVLALEQGLGDVIDNGGSSGAYPYGSGIRWDVDVSKDFGARFSSIEVKPKDSGTWEAIDSAGGRPDRVLDPELLAGARPDRPSWGGAATPPHRVIRPGRAGRRRPTAADQPRGPVPRRIAAWSGA